MKTISVLLKLFIIVATFAYAAINTFTGWFTLGWGTPTLTEQFLGIVQIGLSLVTIITSLLLFKKKIFIPFIILFASSIVIYIAFAIVEGFSSEFNSFEVYYLILLPIVYWIINYLKKK